MALMETRIVQVANDPEVINHSNETWGMFGWSVLNIQITHSQNTKTYTKGFDYWTGDKTVETTTLNYATITYQRDKEMPNYARIAALQTEAEMLVDEKIKPEVIRKPKILTKKNYWIAFGIYMIPMFLTLLIMKGKGRGSVQIQVVSNDLVPILVMFSAIYLLLSYMRGKKKLAAELASVEKRRKQEEERCENRKQEIADRLEAIEREARSLTA